jgi:hypothetical protein
MIPYQRIYRARPLIYPEFFPRYYAAVVGKTRYYQLLVRLALCFEVEWYYRAWLRVIWM